MAGVSESGYPSAPVTFFPRYQMQDRPPTPVERVYQLAEEARNWLAYVYTGNC